MKNFEVKSWPRKDGASLEYIETTCIGTCDRMYRIDEHHPEYRNVLAALEQGDRSKVFCYHDKIIGFS